MELFVGLELGSEVSTPSKTKYLATVELSIQNWARQQLIYLLQPW